MIVNSPPPDDGVCEDCDGPLDIFYQERVVAMIGDTEIVELICFRCKLVEGMGVQP